MLQAVHPYHNLSIAMLPAFVNRYPKTKMFLSLERLAVQLGAPNSWRTKANLQYNYNNGNPHLPPQNAAKDLRHLPKLVTNQYPYKPVSPNAICQRCGGKGHYAHNCWSSMYLKGPGINHVAEETLELEYIENEEEEDIKKGWTRS